MYQCRCTRRTKTWKEMDARYPEDAAWKYGEEEGLGDGEIVTVRGVGRYELIEQRYFEARKIRRRQ